MKVLVFIDLNCTCIRSDVRLSTESCAEQSFVEIVQMEQRSKDEARKTVSIPRLFWVLCIVLFLLVPLLNEEAGLFILNFLKYIPPVIGSIALLLLVIGWIMPGLFIVLGKPWLAHKSLRRINPVVVSARPWEQLSSGQKILTYIWSLILSGLTLFAVITAIRQVLAK